MAGLREIALAASSGFDACFRELIAHRRAEPRDDILSALVQVEEEGDVLTEREMLNMLRLLLVSGNETATNLVGNGERSTRASEGLYWQNGRARLPYRSGATRARDQFDTARRHSVDERRIMLDEHERRRIAQHGVFDAFARVDVDEVQGLVPDQEIRGCRN